MTIQEKKTALIEHIQNENSEEMIDRIYDDVNNMKSWELEYGQNILNQLLIKSQEEVREGKTYTSEQMKEMRKERMESRKLTYK
ncbi:hypothetical protein [Flavobacterium restrictum]|uniref:Uncharacterized protein n=1 Tax=Flavobacterium restrictum TaxID=2594428 RepID=A0A553E4T5_9FLAO|nr:hypothetical protein [Flavobacterium restrictum]TRX40048.1 hypothetical protein FNW21_07515 [Flavobacterium restrictum]